MKCIKSKVFSNGVVYALETGEGNLIETTDTFLPFYTKDAVGEKQNTLKTSEVSDRSERWMVGVSTMSGCPVGCKFCATGRMKGWRKLTAKEIVDQVMWVVDYGRHYTPVWSREFKVNYTRMGEPFLNIDAVKEAVSIIDRYICPTTHHYISTIGLKDSDFSWIEDNISLQISLHSLDEERRQELIPIKNLMSIEELGQIRTKSKLKTTVNLTLVDEEDFNIEKLKRYFDPEHFFIKLSPINPNTISENNALGSGIIKQNNLI